VRSEGERIRNVVSDSLAMSKGKAGVITQEREWDTKSRIGAVYLPSDGDGLHKSIRRCLMLPTENCSKVMVLGGEGE